MGARWQDKLTGSSVWCVLCCKKLVRSLRAEILAGRVPLPCIFSFAVLLCSLYFLSWHFVIIDVPEEFKI